MSNALLFRPLTWASITASSQQTGFAPASLSPWPVPRMGRVWRSATGGASQTLTIDLGADTPLDTIAVFGLGNQNAAPSASWQWTIALASAAQGAFTGAFWNGTAQDALAGSVLPVSGFGKALWRAPSGAPAAARYVRITFSGLSNASVQAAIVAIGKAFVPARNYSYGAAFGVRDLGVLDYSPRGVIARRAGARLPGFGLTFNALRREEVEGELHRLFEQVGNTDPVVLVTDPADHAERQNRIGLGHLTGNLGSVHRVPGFWQAEINFVRVA